MGNVTSIKRDGIVKDLRQPDPELINLLEDMLVDARAGEIVGIAGVACGHDMLTRRFNQGVASWATVGRLHAVAKRQTELLMGD